MKKIENKKIEKEISDVEMWKNIHANEVPREKVKLKDVDETNVNIAREKNVKELDINEDNTEKAGEIIEEKLGLKPLTSIEIIEDNSSTKSPRIRNLEQSIADVPIQPSVIRKDYENKYETSYQISKDYSESSKQAQNMMPEQHIRTISADQTYSPALESERREGNYVISDGKFIRTDEDKDFRKYKIK